jgi:ABC-type cobalamin/Fe3+-siderophores transport system ATPase subunit
MSFSYEEMHAHTSRHNVKGWLIRGAEQEDAQTILKAIKRMDESRLARRLARILSGESR